VGKNVEMSGFLRSRRARLRPEDVGIPPSGGRRVPGLRREEVASLAGVSLDYYARLEQGRDLQPSDQVLDAIARALRLAPVERNHLHDLVRSAAAPRRSDGPEQVPLQPGARLMLDSLEIPAIILDAHGTVQAINRLGRALLVGLDASPSPAASHPRWIFLEPSTRELMTDWEMVARSSVGVMRQAAGRAPNDTALHSLIGELSVASPEFRSWWAEHDIDTRCGGPKRFHHPFVGDLVLHVESMQLQDGQHWLYAYAAEPGSRSAESLRLLGTWSATEEAEWSDRAGQQSQAMLASGAVSGSAERTTGPSSSTTGNPSRAQYSKPPIISRTS